MKWVVFCCCLFVGIDAMAASPRMQRTGLVRTSASVRSATDDTDAAVPTVAPSISVSVTGDNANFSLTIGTPAGAIAASGGGTAAVAGMDELATDTQRDICVSNNIGLNNTFVWAAQNSATNSYATMIEDVTNPENNACFARVDIGHKNKDVSVKGLDSRYFKMGNSVVCGSWLNRDMLEKNVLDGLKQNRTFGTVAAVVGGMGVGVGVMEAFGNRLIGGKVLGQKALEGQAQILSLLAVLKKDSVVEYQHVVDAIKSLNKACKETWADSKCKPDACDADKNPFIGLEIE